MKITFLGTGTSQGIPVIACKCEVCLSENPLDKRLRSSVFIESDGLSLVIDAGPDFRQQMLRAGIDSLSAILLTHEHYDHIAGLDDIRAYNWVQKRTIDIYAEKRVHEAIERIFSYVFAPNKYPGIPRMNLHVIDQNPFLIENIRIVPIRGLHHKLPVLGFRIGNFAYLTDFKTIENSEIEKLKGLDILVINALRKENHLSHSSLQEALDTIERIKPGQAFITHVSHQMGKYVQISCSLPPHISLAYDGLVLSL